MEREDFSNILVEIFRIRGCILGKVDLQKTVYLAKRLGAPVPFGFRWNVLGPYSYDLAHYCDHLTAEGLLAYTGRYCLNEEKTKTCTSRIAPPIAKRFADFFKRVEEICGSKGYDMIVFMECLSSLDFIWLNIDEKEGKRLNVFRLLDELKPEKIEKFRKMKDDALNLLLEEDLIQTTV
jgi:hypothetical protein